MKTSIIALLVGTAAAQPPTGTAVVDGGSLDTAGYAWWLNNPYVFDEFFCVNTNDCQTTNIDGVEVPKFCNVITSGGKGNINGAISVGTCFYRCNDVTEIDDSPELFYLNCNENTDEGLMALDAVDSLFWNYYMQGGSTYDRSLTRAACTTDADCTGTGDTCGLVSLDTFEGTFCVPMSSWCYSADVDTAGLATGTYTDGVSMDVPNSLNKFTVNCPNSASWLWQTNNAVKQVTLAACATDGLQCGTITWNGSANVPATCGIAIMDGYTQLGCYPTADCETVGGVIPGSTATQYKLFCGVLQHDEERSACDDDSDHDGDLHDAADGATQPAADGATQPAADGATQLAASAVAAVIVAASL